MKIGFNFLTIMEDWKSPDVSAAGMISRNNQKGPSLSQVNETENLKELFDTSKTPIIKLELEAEKEICKKLFYSFHDLKEHIKNCNESTRKKG